MTGFSLYTKLNNDNAIDNNTVSYNDRSAELLETFSLHRM